MKRSHSEMASTLSELPRVTSNSDPRAFKSTLEGLYNLLVVNVVDISKPIDKPVEDVEEPEEEEAAREKKLSRGNARMLQLDLKDSNSTKIRALETEPIDKLANVKANSIISIRGPVDVRCNNIMLEKKHVVGLGQAPPDQLKPKEQVRIEEKAPIEKPPTTGTARAPPVINLADEDWDEADEDDCIILDQ